eukprot:TRINITY_DN60509_c0_g1_i1.p1 TRINITY_DN60509_c0_g1~~TRINITY_DN60509_c0_g1_i1.p1  ORF type:complete len:618 (+),score=186.94 TRINITY_DN60509_c0_g1_i1:87-1856(+)
MPAAAARSDAPEGSPRRSLRRRSLAPSTAARLSCPADARWPRGCRASLPCPGVPLSFVSEDPPQPQHAPSCEGIAVLEMPSPREFGEGEKQSFGGGAKALYGVASEEGDEGPAIAPPQRQWILLPALWALVGFSNNLPGTAFTRFMMDDLEIEPATQALVGNVASLAWNFKIVLAYLSDNFPICGRRRKPYLYSGALLQLAAWGSLWLLPPAAGATVAFNFLATLGQVTVGVMSDTLIVETMRAETAGEVGSLQSNCWIGIHFGGVAGGLCGGFLLDYTSLGNQGVFAINALLKATVLLLAVPLFDPLVSSASRVCAEVLADLSQRFSDIWAAMHEACVWRPLVFIFVMGITPDSGDAFNNFLLSDDGLAFTSAQFSVLNSIGGFANGLGAWLYKRYLRETNWRVLFPCIIVLSSALSAVQLLLIFRINVDWGIPDLPFALGDSVIKSVVEQLISMPILILLAKICPEGVEGSVYALVTTVQMSGGLVGGTLSAEATKGFGITLDDFSNLWRLTLLVSCLKLLPLACVPLVPRHPETARAVTEMSGRAARLLTFVIFGGLLYSVGRTVWLLATLDSGGGPTATLLPPGG